MDLTDSILIKTTLLLAHLSPDECFYIFTLSEL